MNFFQCAEFQSANCKKWQVVDPENLHITTTNVLRAQDAASSLLLIDRAKLTSRVNELTVQLSATQLELDEVKIECEGWFQEALETTILQESLKKKVSWFQAF